MTDHTNTYPDLVNVEDWLNAKGYTGEAGACHQAMSLIRSQEKRIAELSEAIGLLTTLKPDMEIDANSPVNMATQIVAHVDARIAKLEQMVAVLVRHEARDDTIEVQRARIAELKAVLKPFVNAGDCKSNNGEEGFAYVRNSDLRAARAAIGGGND